MTVNKLILMVLLSILMLEKSCDYNGDHLHSLNVSGEQCSL